MAMQAIITKFIAPTDSRPMGRIKATCAAGTITLPSSGHADIAADHARVAQALAVKLGWIMPNYWPMVTGGLPDGSYVHVSPEKGGAYELRPLYRITARGWWDKHGWHYVAELREEKSGNVVIDVSLYGCRDDWMRVLAAKMHAEMPDVFPEMIERHLPSIYFRDACNVPYEFREVSRKKDM